MTYNYFVSREQLRNCNRQISPNKIHTTNDTVNIGTSIIPPVSATKINETIKQFFIFETYNSQNIQTAATLKNVALFENGRLRCFSVVFDGVHNLRLNFSDYKSKVLFD